MTTFDLVVLGIVVLSMMLGAMRGGVKEILSLAAWIVAFLLAKSFADVAAVWMPAMISSPALRYLGGFILVFVIVMAVAMLLSLLLAESLKAAGLGALDRLLGILFGAVRGAAIVLMLVLLAGLTALPKTELWQHSLLAPSLVKLAVMAKPWLPDSLVQHIHF
ncbi:CvpA family protein [Sulfuriferula thiophila]|uniref:CvpA family protein n=1 Tax=Sulfuriferula thiophila TaxID=1781211 RepID=UPI000F615452|nr:CvpA family protein [Sulfuriferula thiophila]